MGYIRYWGHIGHPGKIWPAQFCSWLKSFRWEANWGFAQFAGMVSWCREDRRCKPNAWIVVRQCRKLLRCMWR
jgi:hypothetical protein